MKKIYFHIPDKRLVLAVRQNSDKPSSDIMRFLALITDCEVREIDVVEFYIWKIFYRAQSLENKLRRALTE